MEKTSSLPPKIDRRSLIREEAKERKKRDSPSKLEISLRHFIDEALADDRDPKSRAGNSVEVQNRANQGYIIAMRGIKHALPEVNSIGKKLSKKKKPEKTDKDLGAEEYVLPNIRTKDLEVS